MQTENRAAPHLQLGLLTLLALGAIVLSLDTAPPNAQEQLRTAAANTAGAASFALVDSETVGQTPSSTSHTGASKEEAVIVYQAPDRVEETVSAAGGVESVLAVGSRRFERVGAGKWYPIPSNPEASPSYGQVAAQEVLFPLQSLSTAKDVAERGSTFRFVPGQPQLLLTRLLGTVPAGAVSYTASVHGEFLGSEQITVSGPDQRISVRLDLGLVNRAPALEAPPASDITTTPPS